jgi:uncharacterized protein YrrD
MLFDLDDVRGYKIAAIDDSIGSAHDVLFDDHTWVVRYLVVDTAWIFGRKVLISPDSIEGVDTDKRAVRLSLTKERIENAPDIDTDKPVSRQDETSLRDYYGWPYYWTMYPAGAAAAPLVPPISPEAVGAETGETPAAGDAAPAEESHDPHLRSAKEVEGYTLHATDGELGDVVSFVIDDDGWRIRYLVVDTGRWLPGRKVLVAPDWAEGISWTDRDVHVNVDRETVRNAPDYDSNKAITRDDEMGLYAHYGRVGYWI